MDSSSIIYPKIFGVLMLQMASKCFFKVLAFATIVPYLGSNAIASQTLSLKNFNRTFLLANFFLKIHKKSQFKIIDLRASIEESTIQTLDQSEFRRFSSVGAQRCCSMKSSRNRLNSSNEIEKIRLSSSSGCQKCSSIFDCLNRFLINPV